MQLNSIRRVYWLRINKGDKWIDEPGAFSSDLALCLLSKAWFQPIEQSGKTRNHHTGLGRSFPLGLRAIKGS